jgi:hypothetical protein
MVSYKERAGRYLAQLKHLKEASAAPLQSIMVTASGAVGGIAAGAIDAKIPKIGPVPITPVVGVLFAAGAALNAEHSWSQNLNSFGSTMIGVALAKETYQLLNGPGCLPA